MDKIILTNYKKLPYKPLSRNEFLTLLIIDINIKKDKILKLKDNVNDLEPFQKKLIANYDLQIEFVKKVVEYNKNELKKNATISVVHKNIVKDLSYYTVNEKNYPELKLNTIKDIFIEDSTVGYTPCKFIKYYKSDKDEDIQSIMVNWFYEIPVANNPKYKEHPYNDNRSFYQAIKNNLDWSKLEALLMKVK